MPTSNEDPRLPDVSIVIADRELFFGYKRPEETIEQAAERIAKELALIIITELQKLGDLESS